MARRKPPVAQDGGLPADLAAGPWAAFWGRDEDARRTAWRMAGRAWSQENLRTPNGWERLLPAETRLRLRFDHYERLVRLGPGSPLYPIYVENRARWGRP